MKCPSCDGTGCADYSHLALSQCERCEGAGVVSVEELDPAALRSAAKAYWHTKPESTNKPFDTLPADQQVNLSWSAANVITAYQNHAERGN